MLPEKSKGTWYGKPLEKYTKEELIDIVIQIAKNQISDLKRHSKAIEMTMNLLDSRLAT